MTKNGHVTDDVMSLFCSLKKNHVEHYFPTNFDCRLMKRRLSTAPNVSAHVHCPLKF